MFFLVRRAHDIGFWSILPGRKHTPRARCTDSNQRLNSEDDGLVMQVNEDPYLPRTKATAEFDGTNEGIESVGRSGIHVIYNVEVV